MEAVESSIVVEVPVAAAYEQWARVEDFPKFMEGVIEVRRLGEERFAWTLETKGHRVESVSEVTVRIPNQRIAWRSVSGAENSGVVSFEAIEEKKTKITLSMKYNPLGEWDNAQAVSARLQRHLDSFKKFVEASAVEDIVERNWQGF